jgi:hypothetical protein
MFEGTEFTLITDYSLIEGFLNSSISFIIILSILINPNLIDIKIFMINSDKLNYISYSYTIKFVFHTKKLNILSYTIKMLF